MTKKEFDEALEQSLLSSEVVPLIEKFLNSNINLDNMPEVKAQCTKCGAEKKTSEVDYFGKCYDCKRKESSSSSRPSMPSDILGSDIPGGYDCDFSTPL